MNHHALPTASAPRVDPVWLAEHPHERLGMLRREYPVIRIADHHYLTLRANDGLAMLTDPRTVQIEGAAYVALYGIPDGVAARFLTDILLFANDTAHRARRALFARAFAHAAIRAARPDIRETARRIVAELPRGESFDFVERVAARVPAEMIAALLGLPASEAPYFAPLVYDLARALSPVYPSAEHDRIEDAAAKLTDYIDAHLGARLVAPRDDLLSTLVTDWQAGPTIGFDSLVNQVMALIIGGSDTTRAATAMTVALLLERPDDWAALRADPSLVPGAVAESLRFEPSVASIPRFTTRAVDIGGVEVPAGVMLGVSTLSAMRDPAICHEPDRFDIRRRDHPRLHPVFGLGPHRCIGEMLARMEMEESLLALISGAPGIEMTARPRMIGFGGIRQITPMPVRIPADH